MIALDRADANLTDSFAAEPVFATQVFERVAAVAVPAVVLGDDLPVALVEAGDEDRDQLVFQRQFAQLTYPVAEFVDLFAEPHRVRRVEPAGDEPPDHLAKRVRFGVHRPQQVAQPGVGELDVVDLGRLAQGLRRGGQLFVEPAFPGNARLQRTEQIDQALCPEGLD